MRIRPPYRLPPDREQAFRRVVRLEWWTLGLRLSIVLGLGLVLGNSQAMKAAWVEDAIGLTPSIAFLVSCRWRKRDPDRDFPYGYQRAAVIAFLCAAVALSLFGVFLLVDSSLKLLQGEYTTIGSVMLFGEIVWLGWLMIAALLYSVVVPLVIGHLQERAARAVHEKTVLVDARMSKADWTTGLAAVVGILGVGAGFWWADAAAGALIAFSVCKDGFVNLREAAGDLLDRRPHRIGTREPDSLTEDIERELCALDWVFAAEVRLREEGSVLSGEAFIVPARGHERDIVERLAEAEQLVREFDWRIYEVVLMPVQSELRPERSR